MLVFSEDAATCEALFALINERFAAAAVESMGRVCVRPMAPPRLYALDVATKYYEAHVPLQVKFFVK